MPDIRLDGPSIGKFVEALEQAYPPERFDQMLLTRLDKVRTSYSVAGDMRARFFDVVQAARYEGWTRRLIAGALDANPANDALLAFARDLGLTPVPQGQEDPLQKVITERSVFHDAEPFLVALQARIAWVCQVLAPGGGGTGVLVAPDLILTNHHVIDAAIKSGAAARDVACLFDFKQSFNGQQISPGRRVSAGAQWLVAARPHSAADTAPAGSAGGGPAAQELDYALIRLSEPVGRQPLGVRGVADPGAGQRQWLTLSLNAPSVAPGDPLIVLQHPQLPQKRTQEPVQIAMGTVLDSPYPGLRVRHNARTLSGSSGSPCFDANLDLVALHHAGEAVAGAQPPAWNQAIPIHNIVADLIERGVSPPFWDPA